MKKGLGGRTTRRAGTIIDSYYHEEGMVAANNGDKRGVYPALEFGVDQYMDEVKAISRLSHDQTMALFQTLDEKKQAHQACVNAETSDHETAGRPQRLEREITQTKERLVTHNLRLVVYLAHRYQGRGLAIQDLIQEGNIGLIQSIDKFDHRLGYRFSTYATYWIRQAMLMAIYRHGTPIRMPIHVFEKLRRHEREADVLRREPHGRHDGRSGENHSLEQTHDLMRLRELMKDPLPLESHMPQDGLDLIEVTSDESQPSPEDRAVAQDLTEKLRTALPTLTQREESILKLRFGIDSPESHTLEEVGNRFKLTKERIRQIESKALKHLHRTMFPPQARVA